MKLDLIRINPKMLNFTEIQSKMKYSKIEYKKWEKIIKTLNPKDNVTIYVYSKEGIYFQIDFTKSPSGKWLKNYIPHFEEPTFLGDYMCRKCGELQPNQNYGCCESYIATEDFVLKEVKRYISPDYKIEIFLKENKQ